MKVLLVHSSAGLYGADRCLAWIAAGLLERQYEVEAVLPFPGPLEQELGKLGVPVHMLEPVVFRRSVMKPAAFASFLANAGPHILKLRSLIRRNRYDMVHSNTGVVVGAAIAARLSNVPHIWHFREILTDFGKLWNLYEPLVIGNSTEIVCISNAVAAQFESRRAQGKLDVVYDGIPIPARTSDGQERRPGPTRLLSIGLLAPYKSQDVLLSAVRILLDRGLDIDLTIVGDVFGSQNSYREALEKKIIDLCIQEHVRLAGFCADVKPFFEAADIFIHPARRPEGLGLVILEAMANGKPVVATRGGGITEIIDDGNNGILVEPGNPGDLAQAVERLMKEPDMARSYCEKALATVTQRFSVHTMIENLDEVYKKVLSS